MVGKARRRWRLARASSRLGSSSKTSLDRLPDDLLVDILSRVPAKSLCRFKCVSKHWLGLIDHPEHRRKLPQTLVGFFSKIDDSAIQFTNVSGSTSPLIDTSFTFLPNFRRLELLDYCDGLFLCRWYTQGDEFHYLVCNPATEKWVMLPDSGQAGEVGTTRLGFDRAMSSHFHVFELLEDEHMQDNDQMLEDDHRGERYITGMYVYSSETGRWDHKEKGWVGNIGLHPNYPGAIFFSSYMHLYCYDHDLLCPCVAAVHMEGETWMFFDSPSFVQDVIIQQSQGRLHFFGFKRDGDDVDEDEDEDDVDDYDDDDDEEEEQDDVDAYDDDDDDVDQGFVRLVVYVLEDYGSKEWIKKHSVETSFIGEIDDCIAIHPGCNTIFFNMAGSVMCYNLDRQQTKVVSNVGECEPPYLPYVPLYAELQSLHM